jgi:hypothetical protein
MIGGARLKQRRIAQKEGAAWELRDANGVERQGSWSARAGVAASRMGLDLASGSGDEMKCSVTVTAETAIVVRNGMVEICIARNGAI